MPTTSTSRALRLSIGLATLLAIGAFAWHSLAPASLPPGAQVLRLDVEGEQVPLVVWAPPNEPTPRTLVLAYDPQGDSVGIVARWHRAARELGWIVASTPAISNETDEAFDDETTSRLLAFLAQRYAVDPSRVIASGFSGGGCRAYRHLLREPRVFAGAIVEGAHMGPWREDGNRAEAGKPVFLFSRTFDFNSEATRKLAEVMTRAGLRVTAREPLGLHTPMEPGELVEAARWMEQALAAPRP